MTNPIVSPLASGEDRTFEELVEAYGGRRRDERTPSLVGSDRIHGALCGYLGRNGLRGWYGHVQHWVTSSRCQAAGRGEPAMILPAAQGAGEHVTKPKLWDNSVLAALDACEVLGVQRYPHQPP